MLVTASMIHSARDGVRASQARVEEDAEDAEIFPSCLGAVKSMALINSKMSNLPPKNGRCMKCEIFPTIPHSLINLGLSARDLLSVQPFHFVSAWHQQLSSLSLYGSIVVATRGTLHTQSDTLQYGTAGTLHTRFAPRGNVSSVRSTFYQSRSISKSSFRSQAQTL